MIQLIGLMIAGYIIFRCVEAICRNQSQFGSNGARRTVQVMAVIGIIATIGFSVGLLSSGATGQIVP